MGVGAVGGEGAGLMLGIRIEERGVLIFIIQLNMIIFD